MFGLRDLNPDDKVVKVKVTLTLASGKKLVIRTKPDDFDATMDYDAGHVTARTDNCNSAHHDPNKGFFPYVLTFVPRLKRHGADNLVTMTTKQPPKKTA